MSLTAEQKATLDALLRDDSEGEEDSVAEVKDPEPAVEVKDPEPAPAAPVKTKQT